MNAITTVPSPMDSAPQDKIDTYDARDLIRNGVQVAIILDNQTYYLRITRAGKLILTK